MENINVRDTIMPSHGFIKAQEVDSAAAYSRATITKKMLVQFKTDINCTNTTDVTGRLTTLYEDLDFIAREIIREELIRAEQGMKI